MRKLAIIDSPIHCPHFHEGTCFFKTIGPPLILTCTWNQSMPADAFPKECPLPDTSLVDHLVEINRKLNIIIINTQ